MKYFLFLILFVHSPAFSLIAGLPPDSPEKRIVKNVCQSPAADAVSIQINKGIYSGILIGKRWVLTAAHVAEGTKNKPASLLVNVSCLKQQLSAKQIIVHPEYHRQKAGNINLFDLALVELTKPVPATIQPSSINFSLITQGSDALFLGYGVSGNANSQTLIGSQPNILRQGQNQLDGLVTDEKKQQVAFLYDFDGPDSTTNVIGKETLGNDVETEVAPGDSGSPIFGKNIANQWSLIGISTFRMGFNNPTKAMPQPPAFGSGGGGILLNSSALWLLKLVPDLKVDWSPLQP